MKYISTVAILIILNTPLVAFSKPPTSVELVEGQIVEGIYKNNRFGWEFPIPKGWKLLNKEEIKSLEGKGKKAIEETYDTEVAMSHVPLLHLRKDQFNAFTSTAQAYQEDGDYRVEQEAIFDILKNTYLSRGITIDYYRSRETIGGLEFEVLHITMYSPDKQTVIVRQIMYDRLIGDSSLFISVMYNNDQDKKIILEALSNSRFTKDAGERKFP
ncbi:conserved hypothetical protein, secreted [Candidatus Thiomargarita nelsonii]|uniref:Secreted protein n=1 Tax=Candidatus Thiomargarita nelsonii TaxID=1003181 RepID=A0A176RUJ7_9GAMM|nr:conserved hypothetical protein, secreted [Candidatus Thiomargarita nelsonii]